MPDDLTKLRIWQKKENIRTAMNEIEDLKYSPHTVDDLLILLGASHSIFMAARRLENHLKRAIDKSRKTS